jgi:Tfp pilus assembly protein PilV
MKKKGMLLLECILAVFLLSAAFMALASVYPAVYRQAAQSKNRFLAVATAANLLESIRSLPYGSAVPAHLLGERRYEQVIEGVRADTAFQVKKIEFFPSDLSGTRPDPQSLFSRVTVTIEWREGTSASHGGRTQRIVQSGVVTR